MDLSISNLRMISLTNLPSLLGSQGYESRLKAIGPEIIPIGNKDRLRFMVTPPSSLIDRPDGHPILPERENDAPMKDERRIPAGTNCAKTTMIQR